MKRMVNMRASKRAGEQVAKQESKLSTRGCEPENCLIIDENQSVKNSVYNSKSSSELGVNNLRMFVNDAKGLTITDDACRNMMLPQQVFWEFTHELDNMKESFQDIINMKEVHYKQRLGGNYYVAMDSPYWVINIQRWFKNEEGVMKPGGGIRLKIREWKAVLDGLSRVDMKSCFKDFRPCYEEHFNQMSMLECWLCCPNGWEY